MTDTATERIAALEARWAALRERVVKSANHWDQTVRGPASGILHEMDRLERDPTPGGERECIGTCPKCKGEGSIPAGWNTVMFGEEIQDKITCPHCGGEGTDSEQREPLEGYRKRDPAPGGD